MRVREASTTTVLMTERGTELLAKEGNQRIGGGGDVRGVVRKPDLCGGETERTLCVR